MNPETAIKIKGHLKALVNLQIIRMAEERVRTDGLKGKNLNDAKMKYINHLIKSAYQDLK